MPEEKTPRKPGPKPRLSDPAVQAQIFGIVGTGQSLRVAADFVGVDRSIITRYRQKNRQFAQGLKQARARGKMALLQKIATANDWKAAAFLLERIYYKEFARREPPRKPEQFNPDSFFAAHPQVDAITLPPGAIPPVPQPREVPDRPSGPTQRQDGAAEAEAGPEPA